MTSPIPLRERLREAKLSGLKFGMYGGFAYSFRSNEQAADEALVVFRDWLRAEAQRHEDDNRYADGSPDHETGYTVQHLERLADAIDKELNHDS